MALIAGLAGACPAPEDAAPTPCEEASASLGRTACVHAILDAATWLEVTLPGAAADRVAATKYLAPARADARLPALFLDVHAFDLHHDLLTGGFGDRFEALSPAEYLDLILPPDTREFHAGEVTEYLHDGGSRFGFTVWDDPADVDGALGLDAVEAAFAELQPRFALGTLHFVPSSSRQSAHASGWRTDVPIWDPGAIPYEAYTVATGFGTVRIVPTAELSRVVEEAQFGFRDVLVLQDAPVDLERVVAGIVTGSRQGDLSHLNVRSAARGTPNCYRVDPLEELASWEGELVRLTCAADELQIEAAELSDAEAWWDALQPEPVALPAPDLSSGKIVPLLEVSTADADARSASVARFGAKGAALATLYQWIDPALQFRGFVVPFEHWDAFERGAVWTVDLGDGPELMSARDTLDRWLDDPEFLTDAALRRSRLEALVAALEDAPVDPASLEAVGQAIEAAWGADDVMVRVRSSSNAEDSLRFSGAGLYGSTSVCLADDRDDDEIGPSRCDPETANERGLARGLRRVWSSLWSMAAYEERDWYGVDHRRAAMGVLVNDRAAAEQASVVGFSGNPLEAGDDRMLINAQAGEASVVSPAPGEVVEKVLLTLEDGQVVGIDRLRASSEVAVGGHVLSDLQLTALGAALATIEGVFPVDEVPTEGTVLLDTEWKVLADGRLVIKQIRPFVRAD